MSDIHVDTELEALIVIAKRAAERVAQMYAEHLRSNIEVSFKSPNDPVTAADRQANDIIVAALASRYPEATVVAEETEPSAEDLLRLTMGGRVFFVDPLDGTREFVEKRSEFATMIGLAEDGEAVAGVVCLPVEGVVLAGRVGAGAFVEDAQGARAVIAVSEQGQFTQARMMVSRSHEPPLVAPLCRRLGVGEMIRCGSAGLKVARVAQGDAELYVHEGRGMKHWDSCAPEAILRAAGGRLTDLEGSRIDYAERDLSLSNGLVASNGVLHPGALSAVTWAQRQAARVR